MPLQLCLKPKALLWEELSGLLQLPEMLLSATSQYQYCRAYRANIIGKDEKPCDCLARAWQGL